MQGQAETITQNVATAFISGTSTPWFELPAGPISYVLGAEYRRETSLSTPGPYEQEGAIDQINIVYAGQGVISGGSFNVKEVFGELSLPIFKDQPFAKDLTFDAAVRYSDYSTSGGSTSWKAGLRWSINDMITLRGTYARAVRAPNITELFQAPTQTFATISDPCDDNNINAGDPGTSRVANCTAAFGALGVALPFNDTSSEATQGVFSGNVNLNPEAADTYTVGIVLQPSFIPGFTFAVDYYNIELANAIQAFSAQTIVNKCYDLPQPNDFCALVTRTATGVNPGRIVSFTQTTLNVAKYTTAGWDISLRWNIDPADYGVDKDIGRFGLSIVANKLDDLTFTELAGATPDSDLGEPNAPEWQVNLDLTWIYGDFTVNYGFNYFSKTERFSAVRRAAVVLLRELVSVGCEFLRALDLLLPVKPLLIPALSPLAQVLGADRFLAEILVEDREHFRPRVQPGEDLRARLAIAQAAVDLLAQGKGQAGDLAIAGLGHRAEDGETRRPREGETWKSLALQCVLDVQHVLERDVVLVVDG